MKARITVKASSIASIFLLVIFCITLTGCGEEPSHSTENGDKKVTADTKLSQELDIETEQVKTRQLATNLHVTGQIQPEVGKEIDLTSRVGGKVVNISVVPGQSVKQGQILATIDSHEISQIEAELIESKAEYNLALAQELREKSIFEENYLRPKALIEAKTQLEEARVQLELAEREFKRQEELLKERISAAKEYYVAQARLVSAQAAHRQKKADVEREERLFQNKAVLKRDYLLAQAETHKAQKHMNTIQQRLSVLGMTKKEIDEILSLENPSGIVHLRTPIAGVVTHREVNTGETIDRNTPAFVITDLSNVTVVADIPEVELRHIRVGEKIEVRTASFPNDVFTGTISYISSTINPQIRTVPIRAVIRNPSLKLKTNMFAEIDLKGQSAAVLTCPKGAVQETDGRKVVFVHDGEEYKEHPVKLGISDEKYFEVISGLTEGDKVVTSGSLLLKTQFANVR